MHGHVTIVIGSIGGDEGKGKIANWITYNNDYDIVCKVGVGPNAGHSIYQKGKCIKTNQLPVAGILPTKSGKSPILCVGSGVVFDAIKALNEINTYNLLGRVKVDYRCALILQEHIDREASGESYSERVSGSTKTGCAEAKIDHIRRIAKRVCDLENNEVFCPTDIQRYFYESLNAGKKIILEGSQAYSLNLFLSKNYPVCTSKNCTANACADDCGIPWNKINDVVMCVKSAPTMVAQNCGTLFGEISKDEIIKRGLEERGVTTGRLRRKSLTIDFDQLEDAIIGNGVSYIALSFCDHVDPVKGLFFSNTITLDFVKEHLPKTFSNITEIEKRFNVPVKYIEYGKEWNQISEIIYK